MNKLENENVRLNLPLISRTDFQDKAGPINAIPMDILRYIFLQTKGDLPTIACVNKNWKAIAYNQVFRNQIVPTEHFFGNEVWKKLGVDVENEPHLPLCIYRDVGSKDFLGLVHKSIIIDGKELKLTPKLLGELTANKIKGLKATGFSKSSWKEAINNHKGSDTLHWVWIKAAGVGKDKRFPDQENSAKTAGGEVSEYFDTLVCFFLNAVKFEKPDYNWDKNTWIRVKDKIDNERIMIGFALSGSLWIDDFFNDDSDASNAIVAVARKSNSTD